MRFLSLCSGIDAASVAFNPLGWKAVAFSEIEPFPSAVLAHHYPDVPNLGDMTKFRDWPEEIFVEADAIVGGPPCQAFSVAGLRRSLDDARGNLTLTYVELINHADRIRLRHARPRVIALYENVPGILSTKDNAYGCLLGAIVGADSPLVSPSAVGWTDAGVVAGPERTAAWRTLDAQYFGLAQRRRRVFVVASAGDGPDPAKILFEWDGLRRDSPPSRQAREGTSHSLAPSLTARGRGVERTGESRGQDPVVAVLDHEVVSSLDANLGRLQGCAGQDMNHGHSHLLAFGGNRTSGPIDVAPALLAQPGSGWKGDFESETFIAQAFKPSHFTRGKDGAPSEIAAPLTADADRGDQDQVVLAPVEMQRPIGVEFGPSGGRVVEVNPTLDARAKDGPVRNQLAGAVLHPPINFGAQMSVPQVDVDLCQTLQAKNPMAVAVAIEDPVPPLMARSSRGGAQTLSPGHQTDGHVVAVPMINMQGSKGNAVAQADGPSFTLSAMHGHDVHAIGVPYTIHGTDGTARVASQDELAQCLRARTPGNIDNSSTTVVAQPVTVAPREVAATIGQRMRGQDDCCADNLLPVAVGFAQNQRDEVRLMDVAGALAAEPGAKQQTYLAVGADCFNGNLTGEVAATMGTRGSSQNSAGPTVLQAAYGFQPRIARNGRGDMGEVVSALNAQSGETGKGDAAPCVAVAFDTYNQTETGAVTQTLCSRGDTPGGNAHLVPAVVAPVAVDCFNAAIDGDVAHSLRAGNGNAMGGVPSAMQSMQVRRLTPVECERLQGFPDGYTAIPWRTYQEAARKGISYETLLAQRGMTLRGPSLEECPDGPRYKALGNSWAVPCARWIGQRIQMVMEEST